MNTKNVLRTWTTLCEIISSATEAEAAELLKAELKGERRRVFLLRCHSRMNRMRALRERREIVEKIRG